MFSYARPEFDNFFIASVTSPLQSINRFIIAA